MPRIEKMLCGQGAWRQGRRIGEVARFLVTVAAVGLLLGGGLAWAGGAGSPAPWQLPPNAGSAGDGWHAKGRRARLPAVRQPATVAVPSEAAAEEPVEGPLMPSAQTVSWEVVSEGAEVIQTPKPLPAEPVVSEESPSDLTGDRPAAGEGAHEQVLPSQTLSASGLPPGIGPQPDVYADAPELVGPVLSEDCAECGVAGPPVGAWGGPAPYWAPGECYGGPCCPLLGALVRNLWVRTEYSLGWIEGFGVPALVTTQDASVADRLGVLDLTDANSTVLFGGSGLAGGARSGGRIRFGSWFDPCRQEGIEASYMGLGHDVSRFAASNDGGAGDPILARPFFDVAGTADESLAGLVGFPDLVTGSVLISGKTTFQGVEILYRRAIRQGCWYRLDLLTGWRFNRLDDELLITESKTAGAEAPEGIEAGTTIAVTDLFETENKFFGYQIGLEAALQRRRWTLELLMKLALGNSHSVVTIDGSTVTDGGAPVSGGLLALGTNMGTYANNEFAVIPELGITVGYQLTRRLRATFGWSFLYWSRVARPGDQIDLDVNLTQRGGGALVGLARPESRWVGNDVWIQGLNFGLDWRF